MMPAVAWILILLCLLVRVICAIAAHIDSKRPSPNLIE